MPQAVSLFPVAPPQSQRPAQQSQGINSGPSKFDEALDSAQQADSSATANSSSAQSANSSPDSTDSPAASDDSAAADKSSQSKPAKNQKTTATKVKQAQTRSKDAKAADDENEEDEAAQVQVNVAGKNAEQADAEQSSESKSPAKSKDTEHAEAGNTPALLPQPTAQQPAQAVQTPPAKSDDQHQGDADAGDQPSKGLAAVKAIAGQDDDEDPEPSAEAEAQAATPKGKATTQVASVKLGQKVAISAKTGVDEPANADMAVARANSAASASASAGDDDLAAGQVDDAHSANTAAGSAPTLAIHTSASSIADTLASAQAQTSSVKSEAPATHAVSAPPPAAAPEAQFADTNHAQIVSGIQGQLLPNGGTMQMHLNPGELGAMSVSVQMRDGVMTATFATSTDQAAKLLSHSLGQLKTALESQGVSVGRLHVEQSPKGSQTSGGNEGKSSDSGSQSNSSQQQEQQRRDMLRKMWRRLNGGKDPLDMVA